MALEYFLYNENYNNTLVDRSDTSFAPLPLNYGQIYIDFLIPSTQPLYYFKEDGGLIVSNDDATIEAYLKGTAPPPESGDDVIQSQFTGYTATTKPNIDARVLRSGDTMMGTLVNTKDIKVSGNTTVCGNSVVYGNSLVGTHLIVGTTISEAGSTLANKYLQITNFNGYSGTTKTDIDTRVFRSGDTMTGSLGTSGNLTAVGAITGSSLSASVLVTTPVLNASTSVSAPQITGTTCITTPISCATTLMQSPVVCGGTCVISPITIGSSCVCSPVVLGSTFMCSPVISASTNMFGEKLYAQTCFCSIGTSVFDGNVTAASLLNVSGETTLGGIANFESEIHWHNPNTGGTLNDYGVKWDPVSQQIRTIPSGTGGTANVYCYSDKRVVQNNTTITNATYLTETWNLPSGCYEYVFNALYGNTSSNRCATVCFLFDGAVIGECNLMKTNDGAVITTAYVTQNNELLTTADHTISIVFRQQGGGTAFIDYGVMRVQKIGEIE